MCRLSILIFKFILFSVCFCEFAVGKDKHSHTDLTTKNGRIQLKNEVQTENMSTSGERFIAVKEPCTGCDTYVDPNAAGVKEMASMGIRQLDRLEPATRHTLNNVTKVIYAVTNKITYTITLIVDYDNCTANKTENCNYQKTCRIRIHHDPWQKLPGGSEWALLSNNCTEEWLFNKDSSRTPNFNNQSNKQGQPTAYKTLTDEQIRDIEKQIVPLNKVKPSRGVSATQQTLSDDKKKAIDDFMNFYNPKSSGYKDKSHNENLIRMKKDYSSDIQFLNLADNYQDMKTKIKNAQFIQKL